MARHKIGYRKSQKIFTREASQHKALNQDINVYRGGIRL